MSGTILVATVGQGIVRSADDGKTWHRLGVRQDIEFDAIVRSLDMHADAPEIMYAGTDTGLCISEDTGGKWSLLDTPFKGETVWKVAVDPADASRIFVGTGAPSRAVLWRTTDGCKTWFRAPVEIPEFCAGVNRPRLLAFSYDPTDRDKLWFGLEEGGLFHSRDGGDNWERLDGRLLWEFNSDIHNVHVLPNNGEKTIVVICVNAIYRSSDDGETWEGENPKDAFGLYYARATAVPPGSESSMYLSVSDGTPGTTSLVMLSQDAAKTWERLPLPTQPNSCIWAIHANPANAAQVVMGTKYGHLFTTEDTGFSWQKQWRELSEIADVLWTPATANIRAAHKSVIEEK